MWEKAKFLGICRYHIVLDQNLFLMKVNDTSMLGYMLAGWLGNQVARGYLMEGAYPLPGQLSLSTAGLL